MQTRPPPGEAGSGPPTQLRSAKQNRLEADDPLSRRFCLEPATPDAMHAVARGGRARSPSTDRALFATTCSRMLPAGSRGGASTSTLRSRTHVTAATALCSTADLAIERRRGDRHGVRTVAARATAISPRTVQPAARIRRCRSARARSWRAAQRRSSLRRGQRRSKSMKLATARAPRIGSSIFRRAPAGPSSEKKSSSSSSM